MFKYLKTFLEEELWGDKGTEAIFSEKTGSLINPSTARESLSITQAVTLDKLVDL